MNSIIDDKTSFCWDELRKYEKATEMTEKEKTALHEWVAAGNSVHENGSMGCYENGQPLDFLDVFRYEEEIRQTLEHLTPQEKENYIARLRGVDTVETLMEDIAELSFKTEAYRRILQRHGLLSEAEELLKVWKVSQTGLSPINDDELPFQ